MDVTCFECNETVKADDEEVLGERLLEHARSRHEWPFPDQAIRNYAAATVRLTGPSERLGSIGEVEIRRVTAEAIDDWLNFFDREAFVGKPEWASCYCLEPHEGAGSDDEDMDHWRERRERAAKLFSSDAAYGYLAYVDGHPAAWVNASRRDQYGLYRRNDSDAETIGISCFIVAPPYRRHGLSAALLDRVIADAPSRGAGYIEAYPLTDVGDDDAGNFRGPRNIFEERGFEEVERRERDAVLRRSV